MKKILHKVFFNISMAVTVIAVFIVIINVFARSITSQVPVNKVDVNVMRNKAAEAILNDPKNTKTPSQKILVGMYRAFACGVLGQSCYKPSKDDVSNSLLGRLGNVSTAGLRNPPASGAQEVYSSIANVGLAPKTYAAQGIGFGSISGFRSIWKIFRNVAYGILVLVMVVISFMIMFRMKLNAQTAISIESALPRIVLSLILITFSYALAGFLIDAMYVVMGVVISLLCSNNTYCTASTIIDKYINAGMAQVWNGFFPYSGTGNSPWMSFLNMIFPMDKQTFAIFQLSNSLIAVLPNTIQAAILFIGSIVNLVIVNFVVTLGTNSQFFELTKNFQALTFSAGGLPPALIGGLIVTALLALTFITTPLFITFIIFLTLIFLFFRIFFMLISTYLNILFMILFAPVFMLFEAIPGQNAFSYWIRNMVGELLTFPLLTVFLMVGALIVNNFQFIDKPGQVASWEGTTIWQPPFLSGWIWSGTEQEAFLMVIGMGIIFIIPDLIKMVKEMLGVKPPPVNIGLGTFLAGGALAWGGGMGLMNSAFKWSGMIYGHDAEGRKQGIQGKMSRMFSPVKEAFVKRSPPGEAPTPKTRPERIKEIAKNLTTKHWGTEFEEYEDPNDNNAKKVRPKTETYQEVDAQGNVQQKVRNVQRNSSTWTRSTAGQKQQEYINRMAEQEYDQELKAQEQQRAEFQRKENEASLRQQTANTVQEAAQQASNPTQSNQKSNTGDQGGNNSGQGSTT